VGGNRSLSADNGARNPGFEIGVEIERRDIVLNMVGWVLIYRLASEKEKEGLKRLARPLYNERQRFREACQKLKDPRDQKDGISGKSQEEEKHV